jgi:hypothetical protein
MTDKNTTIKAHCNNCGPFINHHILSKEERHWDDDDARIDGTNVYFLLECCGCERISLRHDSWNSYETDEQGHEITTTVYYPPAIWRKMPEWLSDWRGPFALNLNNPISRLMKEVYSALQNDQPALSAMGIRALIEHVMTEQIGDTGSIGGNIGKFIDDGFVAPKSAPLFREFLIESGHAAMHRGYFPKSADILAMLDIAESLIEAIYVHPRRAKNDHIPPRKSRNE